MDILCALFHQKLKTWTFFLKYIFEIRILFVDTRLVKMVHEPDTKFIRQRIIFLYY